jgi:sialic acid synthase SpsE/spore coat polysaccharide biosynthesis protein SpsF (cytidylyltransferase family)
MKIGVIVLCRYSSTRLPGKALKKIAGRSVLGHIIDRIKLGANSYSVIVATSEEESDDPIARFCSHSDIPCFRGSLKDVSSRFVSCAEAWELDYAVRINGDNIFTDPETLIAMIAIAQTGIYDFITNVPGRTFPYGMSIEILRTAFYREILNYQNENHREHVTSWLYENESVGNRYVYLNYHSPEAQGLQLALDTNEDLNCLSHIIECMSRRPSSYTMTEIAKLYSKKFFKKPWEGKHGPLLIAEIGGNHEGDFEVAKELTRQAISTDVDYIKFQLYRGDSLVSSHESPDRNTHFKRFELTRDQHIELAKMCHAGGVGYMASVWDLEMLDWIDEYMPIYKIGSGDLTAWPIIREFARRGKPIILSTGLATLEEVMQTIAQLQSVDARYYEPEWLCLLQCTSMYPISFEDANLRVMDTLREFTGLEVGYSDHTEGSTSLRTAASMGAQVLEFHFTDSREGKVFRDHKVSLIPEEITALEKDLKIIGALRGSRIKVPQPIEIEKGHVTSFRRGAYLVKSIKAGESIASEDVMLLRPAHGTDARDVDDMLEAIALKNIKLSAAINKNIDYKKRN